MLFAGSGRIQLKCGIINGCIGFGNFQKRIYLKLPLQKIKKNYQLSSQFSLYFKITQVININANCLAVVTNYFNLLVGCSILCGLFGLGWNLRGGFKLFNYPIFQFVVHFVAACMVSLGFFSIFSSGCILKTI